MSKAKKIKLAAEKRTLFGKKVKRLRKEGKIPANIFGKDFKSTAITVETRDFLRVYKLAGKTNVVYLSLEKKEIPVLVSQIQRHPLTDTILHVDFRKVDLKTTIQTEVPVKVVGTSPAVEEQGAEVILQSKTLLVEALPDKIPSQIEVDISGIKEPGEEIKVKDLPKGEGYEIVDEPEKTVVVIAAHVVEEVEEAPAEEAEAAEGETKEEAAVEKEEASKEGENKSGEQG